MRGMLVFVDGGATSNMYMGSRVRTVCMSWLGQPQVAQLSMPNYSGRSTNLYIKVCMVCEVCLFSWMGVRPIYIDLNMYMGSRVRTVCMSWVGQPWVAKLCMPNYSGRSTNSYIKVCVVCEVCLFPWMGERPVYIDLKRVLGGRGAKAAIYTTMWLCDYQMFFCMWLIIFLSRLHLNSLIARCTILSFG